MILIFNDNEGEPINLTSAKRELERSIFNLIDEFNTKTKLRIVSVDIITVSSTSCGDPKMIDIKTTTDI